MYEKSRIFSPIFSHSYLLFLLYYRLPDCLPALILLRVQPVGWRWRWSSSSSSSQKQKVSPKNVGIGSNQVNNKGEIERSPISNPIPLKKPTRPENQAGMNWLPVSVLLVLIPVWFSYIPSHHIIHHLFIFILYCVPISIKFLASICTLSTYSVRTKEYLAAFLPGWINVDVIPFYGLSSFSWSRIDWLWDLSPLGFEISFRDSQQADFASFVMCRRSRRKIMIITSTRGYLFQNWREVIT